MGRVAPNQALAVEIVERLWRLGVRTVCLCPGGRNAPLVEALEPLREAELTVLDFFEERSAAFFALGRARRDRRPVAVVTTSGTAAAELLPAMVEAYYAGTPLVAVTADRPAAFRGTGAPQSIEQANLFGVYARQVIDLDASGTSWSVDRCCWPVHLNVSFDEPLLGGWDSARTALLAPDAAKPHGGHEPAAAARRELMTLARAITRPLVVVGSLHNRPDREDTLACCRRLGAPVLPEVGSHIKADLGGLLLRGGEVVAADGVRLGLFDAVFRIGDIPSFRLWRDLEQARDLPVLSISRQPWRGLTHGVHCHVESGTPLPLDALVSAPEFPAHVSAELRARDERVAALIEGLLSRHPLSEPAVVRGLSQVIGAGSFVYLGNSLPIREWNQFACWDRPFEIGESRGANGIDGQLSAFFGAARPGPGNWAVVGDLTALYDLPSPWALRHLDAPVRLVVINNGGGRIFERLFANPRFQNLHGLGFDAWARMWGMPFVTDVAACPHEAPAAVVELRPDADQTDAFWREFREGLAR
jgi:2-succinyl-5-enolpyruvyl-6-hydroxy-3-cyclohexene-1-carboxylate synthase